MSRRALRLILLAVAPLLVAHRSRCDTPATQLGVPSLREWSDSSGRFHTLGTLVDGDRSSVRIKKESTGTTIAVSLARLSAQDRAFIEKALHSTPEGDRKASSDDRVNKPSSDAVSSPLGWLKDMANSPVLKGVVSLG
ncbi:MAG TPA: SHD1 domain-containing protein, partial [Pirellulales bacterium]